MSHIVHARRRMNRALLQPDDPDLLFNRFELRVAGDEFGLSFLRQRGGDILASFPQK